MSLIIVALIGLLGNIVVAGAFTLMGRSHTKERQFLINAALARNPFEFAYRQQASATPETEQREPEFQEIYPEGL